MTGDRDPEAGLSLVEVLVVLAIVGVASGAAVLSMSWGRFGAVVEFEARQLAARLQLAADDALLTGVARRLDWDSTSYRILDWSPEAGVWRNEQGGGLSDRHVLAEGLSLAGPQGAPSFLIAPDAGSRGALVIVSEARSWAVKFDGLTAQATFEGER